MSPAMLRGLRLAAVDGMLERWPGGWWTRPTCPVSHRSLDGYRVPAEHVPVATVDALRRRGLLARRHDVYNATHHITNEGRAELAARSEEKKPKEGER